MNKIWIFTLVATLIFLGACAQHSPLGSYEASPNYKDGVFINSEPFEQPGIGKTFEIFKRFVFEERIDGVPKGSIPVEDILPEQLRLQKNQDSVVVYRLSHSNLLLKLQDEYWMTDPMFSERASPVQWYGPKRFHKNPIAIEQLPQITGVIISHDHYDHLDKQSIKQLNDKVKNFYVPLGVGQHLLDWGVPLEKIHEFDWWQEKQVGQVKLAATPSNHFSGRGLLDRNSTAWASWVIQTPQHKLFFSGDSGYFSGFKKIGDKYGPFDVTFMENGAYAAMWQHVHMHPKQTLQAHLDVKGGVLFPIHNGTFELAFHSWKDPFEQITKLAKEAGVIVATPKMGQQWNIKEEAPQPKWWRL